MATHTISGHRKATWEIDRNGDTWIVKKSARIEVVDTAAIFEGQGFSGNIIKVFGDISTLGNGSGINVQGLGPGSRVVVGHSATISSQYAIYAVGDGDSFTINGRLFGTEYGIKAQGDDTQIALNGRIFAGTGIHYEFGDGLDVTIGKKGRIEALTGIRTESDERVEIVNNGIISGGDAIRIEDGSLEDGSAHIVNRGKIFGLVYLGAGEDVFDTRKGTVNSFVVGGKGNDEYLVSKANIQLTEYAAEGNDTVKSTVSYALFDNFENLTLLGRKNIDGEGTGGSNILTGNKGQNTLLGFGGIDLLNGGKGNDTLDGSDDNVLDFYIFRRGTGDDTVSLFEDGVDLISLVDYDGVDDMGDIAFAQDGSDVLVTLLGGDSIRIRNFSAANFSSADIAFDFL